MSRLLLVSILLLAPSAARAGLHYSGETYAELPSRWQGFLLDQRALRLVAVKPAAGKSPGPLRARYEQDVARLLGLEKSRKLTADEVADLGALYVRLGEPAKALAVLRPAARANPVHYRLAANLGTAWQASGELNQAAAALAVAVRLAPGKQVGAEQLHLKLVRLRAREKAGAQGLDDLFGVRYVGPDGKYRPGTLAPEQRKKLPAAALAQAQQLALWLPADGRLLWQLAELAGAHGDVTLSAAMLEGCVGEFNLRDAELMAHRKAARAAADALAKKKDSGTKEDHEGHAVVFKPRSSRPLVHKTGLAALPPIDPKKVNPLAWEVVTETTVDRQARATFPKYLRELDGKLVRLSGYLQPIGEDGGDLGAFLLVENPVGCWYCEMPELTGMVLVEMPDGKSAAYTRERIRVEGKLLLNGKDPENFLYLLRDAKVSEERDE